MNITKTFDNKESFVKECLAIVNNGKGFPIKIKAYLETISIRIRHDVVFVNNESKIEDGLTAEQLLESYLSIYFVRGFNQVHYTSGY